MDYLQTVRKKFEGERIAVIASAPSATLFKNNSNTRSEYATIIGVNGGSQLLTKGDFFVSGDEMAANRSWFQNIDGEITCFLRPSAAIYTKNFYPDTKFRDERIKIYERYLEEHIEDTILKVPRRSLKEDATVDMIFSDLPSPAMPHCLLYTITRDTPLSRDLQCVKTGGTSAALAMQVAHIMGASEVHLYGVEFSNEVSDGKNYNSGNYFYAPLSGETGMTTESQRTNMDKMIQEISTQGTTVFSHGPTKLENSVKLLK